ncbi:ErmE/ErmH/ErmO/ErmR family 23S rRNA (adenine(2058)-N(6))-methyltransferase [Marinactinospora rubrisoli]|uniref:ErmE/ErmH/ErmO/ErmR family 23S rRNA (Adenine(2058)-N(6))-methyltransferase n=1 Tax=Marinactinospora rubrisoli TaxID=2715399 RepID=A0ABW2KP00_9ACTN
MRLSQNFLTDPVVARRVVRVSGVGPGDHVLEVGAGEGMLTRPLAATCGRLVGYELDPRLAARLAARFRDRADVRIVHGDFLAAAPPRGPFAVVSNIPYAITSRIVDWCLDAPGLTSATLLTQLEYARKRAGGFGRWSRLTVRTWPAFAWSMAGRVPRDRFHPIPRTDSGILRLRRRAEPLLPAASMRAYRRLVDLGFTGVGGSLFASLRREHPAGTLAAAFRAAGLPKDVVVAHVHPDHWVTLFAVLHGIDR